MRRFTHILLATLTTAATILILSLSLWAADKEVVLHSFSGSDGANPETGVIFDAAGNLYGTTLYGGNMQACQGGCGTVFRLTPSNGKWKETVLYEFSNLGSPGGANPTGLFLDAAGNLYGTSQGGRRTILCDAGGVFFKLTPRPRGPWKQTVLYTWLEGGAYCPRTDGYPPNNGLISDQAGNVYGTTSGGGGSYSFGVAFRLTPTAKGQWKYHKLHNFGPPAGGQIPVGGMVFDSAGNLYGATYQGGQYHGVVFQLSPSGSGQWTETVIYTFGVAQKSDGANPFAGLVIDSMGNLYGSTAAGGTRKQGTVFQLTPGGNGQWTENILHSFTGGGYGSGPEGALLLDTAGNLYGTTTDGLYGLCAPNCGTVFKLTESDGQWTETVLHKLAGGRQGEHPLAGVVADANGNLYGTAAYGGNRCPGSAPDTCGVVFEVVNGSRK